MQRRHHTQDRLASNYVSLSRPRLSLAATEGAAIDDSSSQQVSARGHYLARYITTVKNRERTDHDGSGRSRRIAAMKECINDFGDLRP